MTEKAKRCADSCREWYQAFSNHGKGNEPSVKKLLDAADLIESLCARLEQVTKERHSAWECEGDGYFYCPECKKYIVCIGGDADLNYCPNCGTYMDGDKGAID